MSGGFFFFSILAVYSFLRTNWYTSTYRHAHSCAHTSLSSTKNDRSQQMMDANDGHVLQQGTNQIYSQVFCLQCWGEGRWLSYPRLLLYPFYNDALNCTRVFSIEVREDDRLPCVLLHSFYNDTLNCTRVFSVELREDGCLPCVLLWWPSPLCTVILISQWYSELSQSLQPWVEGRWQSPLCAVMMTVSPVYCYTHPSPLCTVTLILQWYSELSQPSLYYFIDYFLHGQNVSLYSM